MGVLQVLCVFAALFGSCFAQIQLIPTLPSCAAECFEATFPSSSCSSSDLACLCGDVAFLGAVQKCEALSCTIKETLTSTNATLSACGVPRGDVSTTVLAIPASFGSLAILLFLLRMFDRVYLMKLSPGWDDYLLTAGVVLGAVLNFVCYPMVHHGMGEDFWSIPFPDINITLELLYVAEIFYFPSEMFTQLSILAFYRRIFANTSTLLQRGSIFLMVFVVLFGVANTLVIIFQCTPIDFFWTGWTGETTGTCIDINLFSWARAAIEIAVDIAIISLPLHDIIKTQLSWKMKIQVFIMFALGFVVTIVSILRLQSLIQFAQTMNPTYDNAPGVYWSVLECDIFIISACLPSIRSITLKMFPRFFGTKRGTNISGKYYRHNDRDSNNTSSSHHLKSLSKQGKILKSVDLHISHEMRETADDKELLDIPPGHVYGV
ncbi:hypothetical protein F5B22DRAFT_326580 [Xylaria bambusicola]|uniref:uncharacterized protein n=1 Tax=Xylaria bambusicola TaxID=326684 RepID=UPI0020077690|nr:uncharacterized protein F5B22DRAFT_326580 [Xylaria bambusicola]KAI0509560.1 hypothetical protein F5B22DRAFT_326580 [Xylaria bambusicola]